MQRFKVPAFVMLVHITLARGADPLIAQTFVVDDYAQSGDGADDGPAVRRAIAAATAYTQDDSKHVATVQFEKGKVYNLAKRSDAPVQIALVRAERLRLVGDQTFLITHPATPHLSLYRCNDIIVEGFQLDMNPLPYTQGKILNKYPDSLVVSIDAEYEAPVVGSYTGAQGGNNVTLYEPNGDHSQNWFHVDRVEKDGEHFRVYPEDDELYKLEAIDVNDQCVIKLLNQYPSDDQPAAVRKFAEQPVFAAGNIGIRQSKNITIRNVDSYASRAQTIHTFGSEDIIIDQFRFLPKPGTSRLLASTKGGVILRENLGPILVKGSYLNSAADDLSAVSDSPLEFRTFSPAKIQVVTSSYPFDQGVGWKLFVFDPQQVQVKGTVEITAVKQVRGKLFDLELGHPEFEEGFSEVTKTDLFYVKRLAPVRFENTILTNGLKKGMIARGPVEVVDCRFSKLKYGIHHYHKTSLGGGPHTYGLRVEDSEFTDIKLGGIICWNGGNGRLNVVAGGVIRNNTFQQSWEGHGIGLKRQNGYQITGNRFTFDPNVSAQWEAISQSMTSNITLKNNTGDRVTPSPQP